MDSITLKAQKWETLVRRSCSQCQLNQHELSLLISILNYYFIISSITTSAAVLRTSTDLEQQSCCGTFCHYGTFCHQGHVSNLMHSLHFCHSGTFCHYMVTKCAERSTCCTFCHSIASNTITCLFLSLLCVCARSRECVFVHMSAHTRVCVYVCVDVHLSVAACACPCVLLWIVFIIPASISPKLKFCIALSRL